MRSFILIFSTIAVTFGGFLTYRVLQPASPRALSAAGLAPQIVPVHGTEPRVGGAGRGDRPWIRNIDRLGRLASRFKADEYQPRGGGHVHVIQPRAEFFQYSGGHQQKIAIEAETGDIEVEQPADSGSATFEKGSAGPPKRGRLKRGVNPVTIRLYPDVSATGAQKDHVSITLTTDNLYFNNETFEIKTDAIIDQNGNEVVPADQVPIHVTGDYEFDGKGLIVHWNDLEGRLEYLEVTHGDHLTIVHPSGTTFGGSSKKPSTAGPGTQPAIPGDGSTVANAGMTLTPPAPPAPQPAPPVAQLASATAPPVGRGASGSKPDKHGPPPTYRADFEREVRITQGERGDEEKQMATADNMKVDFLLNQAKPSAQPASTGPGTAAAAPALPATAGTPAATTSESAANQPAYAAGGPALPDSQGPGQSGSAQPTTDPIAATQPATQPSEATEPVNVYWVGKLVVEPNGDLSPGVLQPGQSIVHLLGDAAPVHVTRDANDVICSRLDYFSPEGNVALYNSPAVPQVVVRQLAGGDGVLGAQADPESTPPDDAVITSQAINYSAVDHVAVLHGISEAQVQLKADPSDPAGPSKPGMLDLRWQRLAKIYFLNHAPAAATASQGNSPRQQMQVDHAHFEGDVDLRHPQLALKSQSLDTTFASVPAPTTRPTRDPNSIPAKDGTAVASAPATQPALREQTILRHLVATDAVTCQMTDEGGKKQNVECHQLTMDTALSPVGKLYPRKIDFFGDALADAHAFDQTQDIHAGQIGLTFVPNVAAAGVPTTSPAVEVAHAGPSAELRAGPSTQPTTRPVELETMTAIDRVRVKTTEGASASAERLFVQMIEGQPHARLTGKPGAEAGSPQSLATVVDARKNVVIGPTIVSDPKQNIATVEGPGSMHLIRQDSSSDKPRPIDVVFLQKAVMDSPDNVIDILGAVSVVSPDPDGTLNLANGRHVHITLADKPTPPPGTTRPSTRPAKSAGPSTQPSGPSLADTTQVDLMKGKVVTGLVLEKDAVVQSRLTDPAGAILRQSELKADLIRYVLGSTQPGAKGTFIVPVPGQMLVRDHRPPGAAAQPGKAPANAGDPGDSRGATAFQWSRQLTYDEATNIAVFTGDVLIVHQDDDAREEPARLRADKVVAVFEPRPNPAAKPLAAQPGAAPQAGSQLQLKSMTATGNVIVTRGGSELDAPRMDYDPVSGWMVATGAVHQPAVFIDGTGVNSANAGEVDWNSQTWNVKLKDIVSRTGRR
jgi:lipopolysaccharide export system protein LptA